MLSADALPTGPVFHSLCNMMLYNTHINTIGRTYAVPKKDNWKYQKLIISYYIKGGFYVSNFQTYNLSDKNMKRNFKSLSLYSCQCQKQLIIVKRSTMMSVVAINFLVSCQRAHYRFRKCFDAKVKNLRNMFITKQYLNI